MQQQSFADDLFAPQLLVRAWVEPGPGEMGELIEAPAGAEKLKGQRSGQLDVDRTGQGRVRQGAGREGEAFEGLVVDVIQRHPKAISESEAIMVARCY